MDCDFINPSDHYKCITKARTRIVFLEPLRVQPIVKVACDRHGDMRFNSMSNSEIEVSKLKDKDNISWTDYSKKLREIRWNICRRCGHEFKMNDVIWIIEFFSIKNEIQLRMRRSFRVHRDCAESELSLFSKNKNTQTDRKLESF